MKNRKTPIASFYCNLLIWEDYYKNKWFPYTMPISDIMGLDKAADNILEEGTYNMQMRHKIIGEAVRKAVSAAGLKLYIEDGFSNTVTVIKVPSGINDAKLRDYMSEKFNVMIAGSFGYLGGKVIRIGHMGENARLDKVSYTLSALQESLKHFGFEPECNMAQVFTDEIQRNSFHKV